MSLSWKPNWQETQQRFIDWWNHRGLVMCTWGAPPAAQSHEAVENPGEARDMESFYREAERRARLNHYRLSRQSFRHDVIPVSETIIGPGSLALYMGSEAGIEQDTVWFKTCMDPADPESHPPLRFDPDSYWWKITERTLRACAELGRGKYLVGCPDLVENVDTLASLRGTEELLMDMLIRPGWVSEKVEEINQAWFECYDRVYDIIRQDDGSACFEAFRLWGPGKTAKVQCDMSAMFSTDMFQQFVVPALTAQCHWLDYSMYHLDGPQAIRHLDLLLDIDPLDAIEWTPGPNVPSGGDPEWFPMYRRIREAGKSVQVVDVQLGEVEPLIDAIGPEGLYIMPWFESEAQADEFEKRVAPYRNH